MNNYSDPCGILEDLKNQDSSTSYFFITIILIITAAIVSAFGSAAIVLSGY